MADNKLSNLEKKKQELEQELASIQNGIDQSIDDVKEGVSTNMDPKNLIRKYPLPLVGASLVVGFLLGREKKGSHSKVKSYSHRSESPISKEIKRIVAKKGLSLLLDYVDNKVSELKHKSRETDD